MAASAEATLATPFERIGGHAALRRITDRFYDLMESDPAYAALRAMHAADLAPMRAALPSFLAGWCGGPRDWWQANPGKCMMSLHSPFPIDQETAGQWAQAMRRAIADVAPADAELAQAMGDVLERMALGMARDGARG
ncbi:MULTISPECIES: group II truncated hemoglobin [unclassified Novosphingobium]|uniref:group II truncated hemoglobin n=1 Tax=unclassified Novosphingobium TaxID=2644732 RepID=UPI00144683A6|nr:MULTISPECIES: group II truncated hemoglobin [unclassified Novosphingobium]NKJ42553.1 hemoglobin [Novosphingobium sp. SG720]NMN05806.1 hemoglobin [Novosphingobium sp. SG919]NMN87834.1 hemoglobin [Novosphingobium sp. SG916]